MELERRYVNLNHRKGEAFSQMTMEEDLNVPDQKPDIYKIIHGQGEFRPDEIKGETGKIKVRGIFLYRILYISENVDRMPEMLEGSVPVDETVFLNGLEEGDMLDVSWKQEDFRVSAVHSRKANMKCVLSFSAEASREQPVPLLEQPEAAEDLYLKTSPVSLKQEMLHKKDTVRVREDVTISPGKPNIRRILWREVRLQGAEARQEDGKILVKGELAVFFLYESDGTEIPVQWEEKMIPFRNETECEMSRGDLTGRTEVTLLRADMELQADYDGEPRMIRVDAVLELKIRYYEERVCEVLEDAYSLSCEMIPGKKEYAWDDICQMTDSRARVSGRMKIPEQSPEMMQILCAGIGIHTDYSERTEQGILIQGNVEVWVLYASTDDAMPFACVKETFPFEHTAEIQKTEPDAAWQITAGLDQLMVSMLDARELEMKAVLQIQVEVRCPRTLTVIEELTEQPADMAKMRSLPGIAIHIVQPGEDLWSIAKTHGTSCKSVMELNDLKEETLHPGSRLLIVKEIAAHRNSTD